MHIIVNVPPIIVEFLQREHKLSTLQIRSLFQSYVDSFVTLSNYRPIDGLKEWLEHGGSETLSDLKNK